MANYDLTYEGSRVQGILDTGNSLKDAGYIFRGEATPSTMPGTPTERVAYIGGPGTYTNFGGSITVGAGCICVFKYTGSAWSNQVINTGLDSAVNTLQSAITAINNNIGNGYVYAGVATPSTSPVTGKVFYLAVTAGTYTNFGNAVVTAGLNLLKKNGSAWSVDQVIAIDAEPTQGSDHLVKSGGVLKSIIQNGPAFDLSAYNAQGGVLATYADLSAALTALNALPAAYKKGGMSMKFVLSSDNNYVQFRLMAQSFTTDVTQWAVDDGGVYIENPEFLRIWLDKNHKILLAIEKDGNIYFGAGVPRQVVDYINGKIQKLNLQKVNDIITFIGSSLEDTTLAALLNTKVDKEEGKSLISTRYIQEINSPEFISVWRDNNDKILLAIKEDGDIMFGCGVPSQILFYFNKIYNKLKGEIDVLNSDVEELQSNVNVGLDKVLSTHLDKETMLYSMSFNMPFYYYEANATPSAAKKKRLVFAWLSDIHGFGENYGRFVKYANNYKDVVDFMLVTGDLSALQPNDGGWHDTQETYAPDSEVPILICLGNHDVTGSSGSGVFYDSLKDMDDALIMPWATQIGWTNKGNGSYYYKDFIKDNGYKYRFIILNDYERPRIVADGSWETITYDSSLPAYNSATSYVAGDKVNLNSHSYQAVKSVSNVSPNRTYYNRIDGRYISEQQALWLCNALSSMPDGYQAIICTHQKVGAVMVQSGKFTSHYGTGSGGFQMCQDGDLIVDVIKAFTNRTAINKKYEMTQRNNNVGGEVISGFDFTLIYDFSESVSSTSKIKCCLTGHTHADEVSKIDNLGFDLYDITLKNGGQTFQCDDMPNFGERSKDAFNIVSIDGNVGFKMMRIGQDINDRFELRDNIIINI